MKGTPDPSSGTKNDLATWVRRTTDLLGNGPVLAEVRKCQVETERASHIAKPDAFQNAQYAAGRAVTMMQGAMNLIAKQAELLPDQREAMLAPWKDLYELAVICVHNLSTLPEEMRAWRAGKE